MLQRGRKTAAEDANGFSGKDIQEFSFDKNKQRYLPDFAVYLSQKEQHKPKFPY